VSPVVTLASVAAATAVGSNYCVQPLLPAIRDDLHIGNGQAGLLVTVAQLGYALGLVYVLPLADRMDRRRLVLLMATGTIAALCCVGLAHSFATLLPAVLGVGILSVLAQVLAMTAAAMTAEEDRGKALGRVIGAMAIGILVARSAAGALADTGSWRRPYWAAAVLLAVQLPLLARLLRAQQPPADAPKRTLRALIHPLRESRLLRLRAGLGALAFIAYSALWTTLALRLAGPPFHFSTTRIGAFGVAGLAAVAAASVTGRLVDGGRERLALTLSCAALLVAWGALWFGRSSVWAIALGVVLIEAGLRLVSVANAVTVYGLRPLAPSTGQAAYMTCTFVAAAAGSAAAAALYSAYGWAGPCLLGGGTAVLAIGVWAVEALHPAPTVIAPGPSR
jgi:predicted MFS family arabinose efflux permease